MKLYDDPISPTPRRVRMFIAEKGLDLPKESVVIGKGEHMAPAYRAKVPNGRVPALELDDGTVICESVAICRYLEGLHPEPNLMGRDAKEAALVEMWQRRMEWELLLPLASVFRHSHPKMAPFEDQCAEFAAKQVPVAEKGLRMLEARLGEAGYVAGDRFTIADITAFTTVEFFCRYGRVPLPEGHGNTRRWVEAVRGRPSAAA